MAFLILLHSEARCENLVMLKAAVDDPDLRFPPVGLLDQKYLPQLLCPSHIR